MKTIPLFNVNIPDSVDEPLLKTLHSGYVTQGPRVEEFEQLLRNEFKTNALTVNSGTSALTLALRLAGVGPGDEVITTPMTCSATNLPILSLFATPVFADVDEFGSIDPVSVSLLVTPKTKAIMAVDWGGSPVNSAQLRKIADAHNLKLIIDAAHSFGAAHNVNPAADFVCFSLQAIKHITTIDGGVILCKSNDDFARGKKLRWFGIARDADSLDSRISEDIEEWGYKFHMNDVSATIGIEQMKYVDEVLATHRRIAQLYDNGICDCFGKPPKGHGAYWLYTLRLPSAQLRDDFKIFMAKRDITTSQVHRRNDEYTVFKPFVNKKFEPELGETVLINQPGVNQFSSQMVCIPIHTALTGPQIQHIIDSCNEFSKLNQMS